MKRLLFLAACGLSLLSPLPACAAEPKHQDFVTLTVENDMFGDGADKNYTNGLRLSWFDMRRKPPGWTDEIEQILPFLKTNETTSTVYSLGQNIYTPSDITARTQDPNDRPWAGFLYGSVGMATLFPDRTVDEFEVTLGVVGSASLGEQAQKTVHRVVEAADPKGWNNQLKNEPGLMASWQRRWLGVWHADVTEDLSVAFTPHMGATAGNIYTYANAGGQFALSSQEALWVDKPVMVRPSMPGVGYFRPSESIDWTLFAGFDGRAMARNIFLDGNTFRDSHSVDKKPFVLDVSAGAGLIVGQVNLNYTMVYRTKEFDGQDEASLFGGISAGINF